MRNEAGHEAKICVCVEDWVVIQVCLEIWTIICLEVSLTRNETRNESTSVHVQQTVWTKMRLEAGLDMKATNVHVEKQGAKYKL